MANNFFLNQDPLLFQSPYSRPSESDEALRKQLNDAMAQYKNLQSQVPNGQSFQTDYVGNLEATLRNLSEGAVESLKSNEEYNALNDELSGMVQREIMATVKWKINSNPVAIKNMERQNEIISNVSRTIENEQRQNLNEINDYVKNYSNITFDEYKKIKSGEAPKVKKQTKK